MRFAPLVAKDRRGVYAELQSRSDCYAVTVAKRLLCRTDAAKPLVVDILRNNLKLDTCGKVPFRLSSFDFVVNVSKSGVSLLQEVSKEA